MLSTGDPALDSQIEQYSTQVSTQFDPRYLQALITMGTLMAQSDLPKHNYDIMVRTVYEMFEANKLFAPYRHVRKIAAFGSARIKREEPAYATALDFARNAVDHGYMIITGGGPGIMQASNEGAGAERSFGLNIKLPYEQHSNHVVKNSDKLINFHYFFVRKLNFVSQSDAMVAFPGGFGTMDEVFETLTLIQTGKAAIYPVVLLDSPGKSFWQHWIKFVQVELLDAGLIDEDDLSFIFVTKNPREAIDHIDHFYKIFHSYRFINDQLVIRLNEAISEDWKKKLEDNFSDLIGEGGMTLGGPLPEEADEPLIANLPRLIFNCNRSSYGRLRQLIDWINDYPEAE
jgi:uncharacterized protein (TIGR00730 family)